MSEGSTPPEYVPISLSAIEPDHPLLFETHLRVADKYILYLRKGKTISADRLRRLVRKKVTRFFILKSELQAYNNYLSANLDRAIENLKHASAQEQIRLFHSIHRQILLNLMESPGEQFNYQLFNRSSNKYFEIAAGLPETLRIVLSLENSARCPAHHGINVASIVFFAQDKLKLISPDKVKSLIFGCQLHDIILLRQDVEVGSNQFDNYVFRDQTYTDHGEAGAALLETTLLYEDLCIDIVKLHEKVLTPEKNPKKVTDPTELLGSLTGLANVFDHAATIDKVPPKEAMQKMLLDKMGYYHLEHFQALQETLKEQRAID